jgi:hypothetical protein
VPENDKNKIESYALETANRLHLIQADSADQSEQARTAHLCEEIQKALKNILPDNRNEFLDRLLEKFPADSFIAQAISTERTAESPPAVDESEHKQGSSIESDQNLKQKFKIGDESGISPQKVAELNAILIDFVLKLESLTWNTWRQLSPRSAVRPQGDLTKKTGQFLSDDADISVNQIDDDLKVLLRLIAAMTSAVSRVGSQFAKSHLAKFKPSEIEAFVRMEPGSFLVSHDVKCWKKYKELAEMLNEDSIEMEIRKAIVDYVESLAKGMSQ